MDYEPNKTYTDEFGRVSGVFLVDKPIGKTSHDIVDEYRRKFQTRKVGHAGALDPFASGLLIILVGKAVKLSDSFLGLDKEYDAEIAFGFKSDTLDTEGKIIETSNRKIAEVDLVKSFSEFMPEYYQSAPIYSSVKVQGDKLRELARRSDSYKIEGGKVKFFKSDDLWKEIPLPGKNVKIYDLKLLSLKDYKLSDYNFDDSFVTQLKGLGVQNFQTAKILTSVSKGTYIRKLAEDIGEKLITKSMLIGLKRLRIGSYSL